MTTMRAIVQNALGGSEVLELAEVERPEPGAGEILVKVHAAGLNPVDWKVRTYGAITGDPTPFTVGWDVSGTVEAVGPGVRLYRVGDEVYGMPRFPEFAGAYAEYVTAPARHFAPKPAGLSHEEAAALPLAALTAYQSLVDIAGLQAGQKVLIHAAAGGVGHLAVQIAKAKGAYVIATASAAKHEYLRGLGADEVIDYTAGDFAEQVSGVDVVLDGVGGDYAARSAAVVRDGGHLVILPSPAEIPESELARINAGYNIVEPDLGGLKAITALVESGRLTPTVSETYALEDAAKAHESLEQGRTIGKIVLTIA
ncbi:NADPH:quinone reductase-like Zn-dependent oxidoreductase [Glycomyces algeriensis]|uniref:NADPH:quinone reductase n=2 Tax=Glycomyces algeriensis TaxID=256037 RepID=A0A9W6G8X5_9ACTN|nr:NADP-dependent oxidoreductase [Glycomyces algeriensis]MDA1365099.1 NADP-dependent oxidoreductase [Glycomyces algeriensis]MDR7349839.1 NADPH:quinone reductase-like Zn-dependent oxidoreductase [Glycomyces algeriensis]GLI42550.1 NADPH:quinone reductase [Glycomyces algeriensis]